MKKIALLTILSAGWLCSYAFAQDKAAPKKSTPSAPAGMAMPKPAPEMKDLRDLVGTWSSEEHFEVTPFMPAGGSGTGTSTVRLGPGGFSVLLEQRSKSALGPFAGHGVMTWDANEKEYKFVWVDSMTPGAMIETGRKDGSNLVYTGETQMMGKKLTVKDVISDRTPASYTLTSYMNDGSDEKKVMTIKFTKQEAAKK